MSRTASRWTLLAIAVAVTLGVCGVAFAQSAGMRPAGTEWTPVAAFLLEFVVILCGGVWAWATLSAKNDATAKALTAHVEWADHRSAELAHADESVRREYVSEKLLLSELREIRGSIQAFQGETNRRLGEIERRLPPWRQRIELDQ